MNTLARICNVLARLFGAAALILGLVFWTGHAGSLVALHAALGLGLVVSLGVLVVLSARTGGRASLVAFSAAWAVAVPILGAAQSRLMPGSGHWVVQVIHLATAVIAIRLAGTLAAAVQLAEGRNATSASSEAAA